MESGIDPGQDYYTQDYYNYDHGLVCVSLQCFYTGNFLYSYISRYASYVTQNNLLS